MDNFEEKNVQILDCTLRDGGFALEDAYTYDSAIKQFDHDTQLKIAHLLTDANIDIIEIGAVEISQSNKVGFAIYNSIEDISQLLLKNKKQSKYAVMFRGPDTPIEQIPNYTGSLCEYIRVILRYSELKRSVEYCAALSKKGYKVSVQPMVTLRYAKAEVEYLIDSANDMNAYALYFVDSYGYMDNDDVRRLFDIYDGSLNSSIHIGFHSHNNLNLAFSNVIECIKLHNSRKIILDSTCLGMGQGAGNMQSEILVDYVNDKLNGQYHYGSILDVCEIIEKYTCAALWGYSLSHLLPAINKTAYKFSVALRKSYALSYKEIDYILKNIPENLRHRYSSENVKELLRVFGHSDRCK